MDVSASNVATLLVEVKQVGVDETTASLNRMGAAGQRAYQQSVASAQDFARAGAKAAQIAQLTGDSMEQARRAVQVYGGTVATTTAEVAGLTAAQEEMALAGMAVAKAQNEAAAAGFGHGIALGRVTGAIGSLDARLLGMSGTLGRFTSMIGGATVGFGPMLVGMLAIGAAVWVWEKLTSETKKARDEQEKMNKAMDDYLSKLNRPAGQLGAAATREAEQMSAIDKQRSPLIPQRDSLMASGELEAANTINNKIIALNKSYDEHAVKLKAITPEVDRLTLASKAATMVAELEVERNAALNAAFGHSQLALDLINIEYAKREKFVQNAAAYIGVEKKQMDDLTEAAARNAVVAAQNSTGWADAQRRQRELAADLPALTAGFNALPPALTQVNTGLVATIGQYDAMMSVQSMLIAKHDEIKKSLDQLADKNKKTTDAQQAQTASAIVAYQKLSDTIEFELLKGVESFGQRGIASFTSFFQSVEQMSFRMAETITKALDDTSKHWTDGQIANLQRLQSFAQAANIGAAAFGGAIQAYDIGKRAGGTSDAGLGGAASGASTGAAIGTLVAPGLGTAIGAVSGAIDGFILGLFGQASKIREARKQFEDVEQKYIDSLTTYPSQYAQQFAGIEKAFKDLEDAARAAHTTVSAEARAAKAIAEELTKQNFLDSLRTAFNATQGEAGKYANQIQAIEQAYRDAIATAKALGLGQDALNEIEATRVAQEKALGDAAQAAINNARFQTWSDANQAAFQSHLTDLSAGNLGMVYNQHLQDILNEQLTTAKDALSVNQQQLTLQQKTVDGLQQTVDALKKYRDSLSLSTLSPLSPNGRYLEARQQYDAQAALAAGGDQAAAQNLPQFANAFLTESRAMFASTSRYVQDYQQVQTFLGVLQDQYGTQLTTEQQILAQLQTANASLNQQITLLNHQLAVLIKANTPYTVGTPQDPNWNNLVAGWFAQAAAGQLAGSGSTTNNTVTASPVDQSGYVDNLTGNWVPYSSNSGGDSGAVVDAVKSLENRLAGQMDSLGQTMRNIAGSTT